MHSRFQATTVGPSCFGNCCRVAAGAKAVGLKGFLLGCIANWTKVAENGHSDCSQVASNELTPGPLLKDCLLVLQIRQSYLLHSRRTVLGPPHTVI